MKLSRKLGLMAVASGAWSYGHAWLSATSAQERVQSLGTSEAIFAGMLAVGLCIAAVINMAEGD